MPPKTPSSGSSSPSSTGGRSAGGPGGRSSGGRGGPGGGRGGPGGGRGGGRGGPGGRRGQREPSEFSETTLSVDRVTRVVKGGRRMRFRAIVVVGNKKGKVGLGTGKATEVQAAVKKATSAAKRAMIRVPIINDTIPHTVELKFKAARIRIMPAMPGTGVIAGGALRVILDQAGIKNVLSKRFGTRNKLVNAQSVMLALAKLKHVPGSIVETGPVVPTASPSGKTVLSNDVMKGAGQAYMAGAGDDVRSKAVEVKEMTKEQIEAQKDIHRKGKDL